MSHQDTLGLNPDYSHSAGQRLDSPLTAPLGEGAGVAGAPSPSPADRLAVSSMSSGSEAEADYPGRARAGGRLTARLTATN